MNYFFQPKLQRNQFWFITRTYPAFRLFRKQKRVIQLIPPPLLHYDLSPEGQGIELFERDRKRKTRECAIRRDERRQRRERTWDPRRERRHYLPLERRRESMESEESAPTNCPSFNSVSTHRPSISSQRHPPRFTHYLASALTVSHSSRIAHSLAKTTQECFPTDRGWRTYCG